MTLRFIKKSELPEFITSPEFTSWNVLPINPARARSQFLNPDAKPDDIVLILALDNETGEIISYTGIFPSKTTTLESVPFAWNSCWWVQDKAGGDAALKVFFSFMEIWKNKVAFSDMTEKTFKIAQNLGFFHTMKRDGIILNLRPGIQSRLRALNYSKHKSGFISKPALFSGIPWIIDQFANLLLNFPQKFQAGISRFTDPLEIKFPEEKDFEFIRRNGSGNFYIPGIEVLKMPAWLEKPTRQNRFLSKKYFFSSFASRFSTYWLRWEKNEVTKALVMISLRDGVLKTHYVYCEEDYKDKLPAGILAYCFANKGIRTLITAQPLITEYISNRKLYIISRKKFTRYSAISNELLRYFENEPILQDGDGDYRFT